MNSKPMCIPTIHPRSVSRRFAVAFVGLGLLSYGAMAGDEPKDNVKPPIWDVYTYVGDKGPFHSKADQLDGGGVSFDFLVTPDRALLVTERPKKSLLLGDQTGGTVSATITISSAPGTTFVHYDDCTAPANVRLHLATRSPIPISPGCTSGSAAKQAAEHTALWWSNPQSFDLNDLNNQPPMTLSEVLDPSKWSDTCGHFGNYDAAHLAAFNAAVSNVDWIGLSFGGGCNFAFGDGSVPAGATFKLLNYSVTH